jgi:hypothetical protein
MNCSFSKRTQFLCFRRSKSTSHCRYYLSINPNIHPTICKQGDFSVAVSDPCKNMASLEPGTPYASRLVRALAMNGANTLFGVDFLTFFDVISIFGSEKISTLGPLGSNPGVDAPPKNMDPSLTLVYDVSFNPKHAQPDTMIHMLSNDSIHIYDTATGKRAGDPLPLAGIPKDVITNAVMYTSTGKLYIVDWSDKDTWLYSCVEVLGARGLSGYRCSQAQKLPPSFARVGAGTAAPFYQMPPCLSPLADPLAPTTAPGAPGVVGTRGSTMLGPATNATVDPVADAFELVWVYIVVGVVACVLVTVVIVVCVVNIMMKGRRQKDEHDTGSSINMTQTPTHQFSTSTMRSMNSTMRNSPNASANFGTGTMRNSPNPSANFNTMRDSPPTSFNAGASQTYSQPSGGNIEDEIPQYSFQTLKR